jgi:two-component system cell cycle response regulator
MTWSLPHVAVRRARLVVVGVGVLLVGLDWLHVVTPIGGSQSNALFRGWGFVAVQACAAAICLLTARLSDRQRVSGLVLGAGFLACALGSTIMTLSPGMDLPVPSVADPLWLSILPCEYVALLALTRQRVGRTLFATRLDGLQAGLAVAAVVGCVTVPVALKGVAGAGDGFWTAFVFMAYPIGDLILLGAVVSAVALAGWRLDRTWMLLTGAIGVWEFADGLYLLGPDRLMNFADALVLTGTLGLAAAVTTRPRSIAPRSDDRGLFVPIGFSLLALGVLILSGPLHLHPAPTAMAAVAMVLALGRMGLALKENRRLLDASEREATTDALTGLHNRRALRLDLGAALAAGPESARHELILLDLNGFKAYNDAHGHNAGDDLLARLGAALTEAVDGRGTAYRMGGDEFCVLAPATGDMAEFARRCAAALAERGSVSSAYGVVSLPGESHDPIGAVALADARMYENKNSLRQRATVS